MRKHFLSVLVGVLIIGFSGPLYSALIFELNFEYSGGTSPAGPGPWLVATFQDAGTNMVSLMLDASGLTGKEFVSEWCFNIAPGFDEAILITPDTGAFNYGGQYSAGPAQGFNIGFLFPSNEEARIGARDIINFLLQGEGLDENDFNYTNTSGSGPFFSAAHVQSIGLNGSGSGWIAANDGAQPVPEPTTMLLLGIGLTGLAYFGRKKFLE